MNNENFHPELRIPPIAHALHKWNPAEKVLSYEYNGVDIISMHIPDSDDVGFRHGSDGSMQSISYAQQIYIMVEKPMWVKAYFHLSDEAICMRPHRAGSEQAIAAQNGNVLIHGINGLYDPKQDLLLEINGSQWHWDQEQFTETDGKRIACMNLLLCEKPVFINLRMHYYRNHLGYKYYEPWKNRINKKAIAGWCSWEAYRRDINDAKIRGISEFMAKHLKDYGMEYIQVDDGYQKMPLPYCPEWSMKDAWMTCEPEKFPEGHEGIVQDILKFGFEPGIWTNANITNPEFPSYHPEDVLFHDGAPMKGEWIDYLYTCQPETLDKHVTPLFEGYRDAGYKYVKIDAIRHLLFDGLHEVVRLGEMTNEEAERRFRAYMEATKAGMSEDMYYLASWGEMHEVVGLADACRISMDANPTWAGIRMQLFEMARWFHTQRILFLNDPDHVCVRTKPEWAKSVLSLISLAGGLCMLSDTQDAYTEEKLEIIRKTLPPLTTMTAETGPLNLDFPAYTWTKLHGFAVQSHETPVEMEDVLLKDAYDMAGVYPTMHDDHPFSTLWTFHYSHTGETWCVVGRFATIPLRASSIKLENIHLDPNESYHVFDFWKECYLGVVSGEVAVRALELGECQILCFRKVKKVPQFIASSRHVSMDAISVLGMTWKGNRLVMELQGVTGRNDRYYIGVPEGYKVSAVYCEGCESDFKNTDGLVSVEVMFHQSDVRIEVLF